MLESNPSATTVTVQPGRVNWLCPIFFTRCTVPKSDKLIRIVLMCVSLISREII